MRECVCVCACVCVSACVQILIALLNSTYLKGISKLDEPKPAVTFQFRLWRRSYMGIPKQNKTPGTSKISGDAWNFCNILHTLYKPNDFFCQLPWVCFFSHLQLQKSKNGNFIWMQKDASRSLNNLCCLQSLPPFWTLRKEVQFFVSYSSQDL